MFLPHKATVAVPLHWLLDTKAAWSCGHQETDAFNAIKGLLLSDSVLVQYNKVRPLVLVHNALLFSIGTVLNQSFPDHREALIAYFLWALSPAERNYSQVDKEVLALIMGVKHFHEHLYSRTFILQVALDF